jgi:Glycosyltransferases involved in cell wall biogenesis
MRVVKLNSVRISILTPSYNAGKYLQRTIESVLKQGYPDFEHIVVDGLSTDNSCAILEQYKHLKWISEKDRGQSDAMNKAFQMASGDLIMYLNADDEMAPGWLNYIGDFFKKNPNVDMLIGNLVTSSDKGLKTSSPSTSLSDILDYRSFSFPLNPVSYAYRSSLQKKIGPFPIDNHYTMDYWFLLRAYRIGKIKKVDFTGGTFYFDGNNKSANGKIAMENLKKARNEFVRRHPYNPSVVKFLLKSLKKKFA